MDLIRYNAQALFVGPAEAISDHNTGNIKELHGIQSLGINFSEPLNDLESADGGFERVRVNPNQVTLNFEYLLRDGNNEQKIGFNLANTGGAFMNFRDDERNYFVAIRSGGNDIDGYAASNVSVICFGQGCLTSYGVNGSIGQFLSANISLDFLNMSLVSSGYEAQLPIINKQDGSTIFTYGFDNYFFSGSGTSSGADASGSADVLVFSGSGTTTPSADTSGVFFSGTGATADWAAVDTLFSLPYATGDSSRISALGHGDIIISFPETATFGAIISGDGGAIVQAFDLNTALVRQENRPLNYIYPVNRFVDPPIEVRLSVNAILNDLKYQSLNDRLCLNSGVSIELAVRQRCATSTNIIRYRLNNARLENTSIDARIGDLNHVNFSFSTKIFNSTQTGLNYPNLIMWTG